MLFSRILSTDIRVLGRKEDMDIAKAGGICGYDLGLWPTLKAF